MAQRPTEMARDYAFINPESILAMVSGFLTTNLLPMIVSHDAIAVYLGNA
jgi:hypothetical protein